MPSKQANWSSLQPNAENIINQILLMRKKCNFVAFIAHVTPTNRPLALPQTSYCSRLGLELARLSQYFFVKSKLCPRTGELSSPNCSGLGYGLVKQCLKHLRKGLGLVKQLKYFFQVWDPRKNERASETRERAKRKFLKSAADYIESHTPGNQSFSLNPIEVILVPCLHIMPFVELILDMIAQELSLIQYLYWQ